MSAATYPWLEQATLRRLVDARWFKRSIIVLIVLSALLLGVETLRGLPESSVNVISRINQLILLVFSVEITLRIAAYRGAFFRDGWNLFDLAVVVVALIPPPGPMQMLRAMRILRAMRLISVVPSLRRVVDGLLASIPGLASIAVLLLLLLYVAAVMATHLYGSISPEHFGTLPVSLLSLFQIMTLEDWPDLAYPIMDEDPWAWIFFISFILVATFMVLNLFIGVVVTAIQSRIAIEERAEAEAQPQLAEEIARLREDIACLREELRSGSKASR